MKRAIKLSSLLCATLLAALFTACQEPDIDDPAKEPEKSDIPVAKTPNSYVVDGVEYAFASVAAMNVGDNLLVVGTPNQIAGGAEQIIESEEYFYGAITPLLLGQKVDVKSESKLFTIVSTLVGAPIESLAPDMNDEVTKGKLVISTANGKISLSAGLVLRSGVELAVNIVADGSVTINENRIARGEENKILRGAFYKEESATTTLWFSPAGLEYFEELSIATWYVSIELPGSLMGSRKDASSLASAEGVSFALVDNANESKSFAIEGDRWSAVGGSVYVERKGEGLYVVDIILTIAGIDYVVAFDGECISHEYAPEVNTNSYLTYNGNEVALESAELSNSAGVWVVKLYAADQSVITATVPDEYFTGSAVGFSWSEDLTVLYNNREYSWANGDRGTITASYNAEEELLNFEFIGYDDLSCVYSGDCTVYITN